MAFGQLCSVLIYFHLKERFCHSLIQFNPKEKKSSLHILNTLAFYGKNFILKRFLSRYNSHLLHSLLSQSVFCISLCRVRSSELFYKKKVISPDVGIFLQCYTSLSVPSILSWQFSAPCSRIFQVSSNPFWHSTITPDGCKNEVIYSILRGA